MFPNSFKIFLVSLTWTVIPLVSTVHSGAADAGDIYHGDSNCDQKFIAPRPANIPSTYELFFGKPAPNTELNPDGSSKGIFATRRLSWATWYARIKVHHCGGWPVVYRIDDQGFVDPRQAWGHTADPPESKTLVHPGPEPVRVLREYRLTNGPWTQYLQSKKSDRLLNACDVINVSAQIGLDRLNYLYRRVGSESYIYTRNIGTYSQKFVANAINLSRLANANVMQPLKRYSVDNILVPMSNVNMESALTGIGAIGMAPAIARDIVKCCV